MVSLKVDNISYRMTSDELLRYFEKYGRVGDVYIPRDPRSRESRGFAFVRFFNRHDAEDAMDRLDGKHIDGREIRVSMARYPRPNEGRSDDRGRGGRRGRSRSRSRSPRGGDRRRSRSNSRSRSPKAASKTHSHEEVDVINGKDNGKHAGSRSRSRSHEKAFDDAAGSRNGSRSRSR